MKKILFFCFALCPFAFFAQDSITSPSNSIDRGKDGLDDFYDEGNTGNTGAINVPSMDPFFSKSTPSFPSPNAASFGIFGNIPVSKYTGVPDIQIPLYEFVEGDIIVPIRLRYHTANRRVHQMPSWVGLGWHLDVGGVITRTVRGSRDEDNREPQRQGMTGRYKTGFLHNKSLWTSNYGYSLEGNVWDYRYINSNFPDPYSAYSTMNNTLSRNDYISTYDHLPDEFSFNFMGYSGTFLLDENRNFVVISEHDIRVEFNPDADCVPNGGHLYGNASFDIWNTDKQIVHFRLITPDGMKYDFGGTDGHATEISSPCTSLRYPYTNNQGMGVTSAWYLTRITSPDGFRVNFTYEDDSFIGNLYPQYEDIKFFGEEVDHRCRVPSICRYPESSTVRTVEGQVIRPVYLTRILSQSGSVLFERSTSNAKKYESQDLNNAGLQNLGGGSWMKLESMIISSYNLPSSTRFDFSYKEVWSERLKLLSVQEHAISPSGTVVDSKPPYRFSYNPSLLPDLGSDRTDHWGFFNNQGISYNRTEEGAYISGENAFVSSKEPTTDSYYYLAEILERITYPTGGYTQFEYEPHSYSMRVSLNRMSLENVSGIAGGVRIKRISSVDKDNLQNTSCKEYFYTYTNTNTSTGILASTPSYYKTNPYPSRWGEPKFIFNSNMIYPNGEAALGSHIGYSEVLEVEKAWNPATNASGESVGSIRTFYTNFDHGSDFMDVGVGLGVNGFYVSNQMYISEDKRYKRGKPTQEYYYRADNVLAKKIATGYEFPMVYCENFLSFYRTPYRNFRGYEVDQWDQVVFEYGFCRPVWQETTAYGTGVSSNTFITSRVNYEYNQNSLLSAETTTNSEGKRIRKEYYYTGDNYAPSSPSSAYAIDLAQRHILNKPLEVRTIINDLVVSGFARTYGSFYGEIYPSADYNLELSEPISKNSSSSTIAAHYKKVRSYTNYDSYGTLLSFEDRMGVSNCVIWGYYYTKPIAFIQNAKWSEVSRLFNGMVFPSLAMSTNPSQIQGVLSPANLHAKLPNAHCYTYSYESRTPFRLVSATDPAGITTYYEYDTFGRLITTRDQNYFILEHILYNYKK